MFGLGGCSGLWGQGGCERRIEVFVKIKKNGGGGGWGGRVGGSGWGVVRVVDVNEELKFLGKFTKKLGGGGSGGGGVGRGGQVGVGLVGGQGGCERNVGGRG